MPSDSVTDSTVMYYTTLNVLSINAIYSMVNVTDKNEVIVTLTYISGPLEREIHLFIFARDNNFLVDNVTDNNDR